MHTDPPTLEESQPPSKAERWQHYLQHTEALPRAEVDTVGTDIPVDSHKILTRHSFATSPLTKGTFVLVLALLGVSGVGLFLKLFFGGFAMRSHPQPTPTTLNEALNNRDAELLRQKLFKANQATEQELARKAKEEAEQTKSAAAKPRLHPQPPRTSSGGRYRVRPLARVSSAPPIPLNPSPPKPPVRVTPPHPQIAALPPRPPVLPPTPAVVTQPRPAPEQQWLEASDLGSYGGGEPLWPAPTPPSPPPNLPQLFTGILPGTRFKGKIDTPWDSVSGEAFRIRVTEDLKTTTGDIALPKGAYLIAIASGTEFPTITLEQLVILTTDGQMLQRRIPAHALVVQGEHGALRAKRHTSERSGLGTGLVAAGLKGVANAAGLANRATVSTTTSGTTTLGYGAPDYGAAVLSGVTDSLANQITTQANTAHAATRTGISSYTLKPGTPVELIVNQPF